MLLPLWEQSNTDGHYVNEETNFAFTNIFTLCKCNEQQLSIHRRAGELCQE